MTTGSADENDRPNHLSFRIPKTQQDFNRTMEKHAGNAGKASQRLDRQCLYSTKAKG